MPENYYKHTEFFVRKQWTEVSASLRFAKQYIQTLQNAAAEIRGDWETNFLVLLQYGTSLHVLWYELLLYGGVLYLTQGVCSLFGCSSF